MLTKTSKNNLVNRIFLKTSLNSIQLQPLRANQTDLDV